MIGGILFCIVYMIAVLVALPLIILIYSLIFLSYIFVTVCEYIAGLFKHK